MTVTPRRPLLIQTERSTLRLGGDLQEREFATVVAKIKDLVENLGFEKIRLDCTHLNFTHGPPMLAIISQILRYREDGVRFQLLLPDDTRLARMFLNCHWAHHIDPDHHDAPPTSHYQHSPARRFANPEDLRLIIDAVMDAIITNLKTFSRDHLKAIEWSLNEIADNVLVHSESTFGGLISCTAKRNRQNVEFVVADGGMGIPRSLRPSNPNFTTDEKALLYSIREGVTRDKRIGQGNGLYGSFRIATMSGGNFSIHANNATLFHTGNTGEVTQSEPISLNGTVVVCGIDYTKPFLLEEALKFGDRSHDPVDSFALRYEMDTSKVINFVMKQESRTVGSRAAGSPVRQKLSNIIRISDSSKLVIDFSGINIISSSFADEVFGKLFFELGPLHFSSKIQFQNVPDVVRSLIDRAIMQRMAVGVSADVSGKPSY